MKHLLRLFCFPVQDPIKLEGLTLFQKSLAAIASEFPSIDFESPSQFILCRDQNFFYGQKIQGPLKPADNSLLKAGQIVDVGVLGKPQKIDFNKIKSLLESPKMNFLIMIESFEIDMKIHLYSGEDIDL